MLNSKKIIQGFFTLFILLISTSAFTQKTSGLEGRWDLVVAKDGKELPSWLEIRKSGTSTLVGRFVYAFGSARPIAEIKIENDKFRFSIPKQWEKGDSGLEFEGWKKGDGLEGTMRYSDGNTYSWTAVPAPKLLHIKNPTWGNTISLFNGKDLKGWHADQAENQWVVEKGILKSKKAGANLISDDKFMNFKVNAEFRYPKGSNSGLYLRGRYEIQITDSKGLEPSDIQFGGLYGFLPPNEMVAKDAGEWQSYEITLIGNRVTIVANGITIINDQVIPGITGGAIDSKEGEPGSFMIQGDHGPIEFRKFEVTPIEE